MLCIAIAIHREIPRKIFLFVMMKVTIPSGILGRIIAIIERIPTLKRFEPLLILSTFLSIKYDKYTPNKRDINAKNITVICE